MKTLHLLMQVLSWIIKDQYLTVRQFFQQGPKHQRWRTNIVTNLTNYKRSLCVKIQSFGITSLRLKMRIFINAKNIWGTIKTESTITADATSICLWLNFLWPDMCLSHKWFIEYAVMPTLMRNVKYHASNW